MSPQETGSLRVAVVEPVARGGLAHYAFQLCRALEGVGVEPVLVTGTGYELKQIEHPFRRVELFRLWDSKPEGAASGTRAGTLRRLGRGVRWYREWLRLIRFLHRERPDVVQLGDLRFALDLLPVMLLRCLRIPLFDICHNIEPFQGRGRRAGGFAASAIERALFAAMYRRMDRIFVHFEANRKRFLARFDVEADRVLATPLGNQELMREIGARDYGAESVRSELQIGREQPLALLFGALSPYKGVERLISALPQVLEQEPETVVVIAGYALPGFDLERHRQLAEELGVLSSLRLVATYVPAPHVHAWFEAADLVVLPYREGFQSGVLHLAQTFGKPTVVSDVGALGEVVADGVNGRVIANDSNSTELAAAICELLGDGGRREAMGAAARKASTERFGWDGVARRLASEYRRVCRSGGMER